MMPYQITHLFSTLMPYQILQYLIRLFRDHYLIAAP